ncbi:hypothetical protein J5N97_006544 [Dioscorea zingiberensis]|uniref:Subtilisin-like protease n=1 Tax=Dioscorea zingiberensis TaxID=325984 RepID=A0A9D5HTN9_9LILI|nr:hypothetical protein J5N97_006544 [Dioscorea zingiberensis]
MGLENPGGDVPQTSLWKRSNFGEDVIIANLDSGMKLIGARYLNMGMNDTDPATATPRDFKGHGTHTLTTAGGNFVRNASIFGQAQGVAKGGAPRARLAAYRVCFSFGCGFDAVLAAFDLAIHDGVDVISVSLGAPDVNYFGDNISIGAFHAFYHGITVVCSAGNLGEQWQFNVVNLSPWVITVGASSIDRDFPSYLTFNNITIKGQSLSNLALPEKKEYPMITGKDAKASFAAVESAADCISGNLEPTKVKGKIVVCLQNITRDALKSQAVKEAGGAGVVIVNANTDFDNNENYASLNVLPATHITVADAPKLFAYLNSTKSPLGYISYPVTEINRKPAPVLAGFSLAGPNRIAAEILKPDVIAPGINILAAYSEALGPLGTDWDTRRVPYATLSGTSMSAPHVAGIAANLRAIYPSWSPARIKSAIMTTAVVHDNDGNVIKKMSMDTATAFDYGAGHVMPNRAMDPGLVYDISKIEYLNYLCDYMESRWLTYYFINFTYNCPNERPPVYELNYPSITFSNISMNATSITRTLTNVGTPGTYKVMIYDPPGVTLKVNPMVLSFSRMEERKTYSVTSIVRTPLPPNNDTQGLPDYTGYVFGRIIWTDGKHRVASQVVVDTH